MAGYTNSNTYGVVDSFGLLIKLVLLHSLTRKLGAPDTFRLLLENALHQELAYWSALDRECTQYSITYGWSGRS